MAHTRKRKRRSEAHGESAALVKSATLKAVTEMVQVAEEPTPTRTNPVTRRCRNCPKMFKATRVDHVFCSGQCRFQFHKHGNTAYGHVKHLFEKQARALLKRIDDLTARVEALEHPSSTP